MKQESPGFSRGEQVKVWTLDDTERQVGALLDVGIPASKIVLVEEHPDFRGYLQFEPFDVNARGLFYGEYREWMSRHLILNELHLAGAFAERLTADGYYPQWTPSTAHISADITRWSQPLQIDGYTFRPFQTFSLNRALGRARQGTDAPSGSEIT